MKETILLKKDLWNNLKKHTPARIALGRVGQSLPTQEVLNFNLAHAMARDAIYTELNIEDLAFKLKEASFPFLTVSSQVDNKKTYLMNPNLGRKLALNSEELLSKQNIDAGSVVVTFGDGLSASAIHSHALPLLQEFAFLLREYTNFKLAPILLAKYARVALSDEIGEKLKATASIIFIGERPGLSSPDSLGIYLTWNPKLGRKEADRNCISNIRKEGLTYKAAANKAIWLLNAASKLDASGVLLKDESPAYESPFIPEF